MVTKNRSRKGLAPSELPPLDSLEAAEKWSALIARAVATGQLSSTQGNAVLRAVKEYRQSFEAGRVMEKVKQLEARLKRRGGR